MITLSHEARIGFSSRKYDINLFTGEECIHFSEKTIENGITLSFGHDDPCNDIEQDDGENDGDEHEDNHDESEHGRVHVEVFGESSDDSGDDAIVAPHESSRRHESGWFPRDLNVLVSDDDDIVEVREVRCGNLVVVRLLHESFERFSFPVSEEEDDGSCSFRIVASERRRHALRRWLGRVIEGFDLLIRIELWVSGEESEHMSVLSGSEQCDVEGVGVDRLFIRGHDAFAIISPIRGLEVEPDASLGSRRYERVSDDVLVLLAEDPLVADADPQVLEYRCRVA